MKKVILSTLLLQSFIMNAQTQIIAHRGYWQTNPTTTENSITALKNAQNLGVYGSEFDVRMTKDGVLVVNHDEHHGTFEISETTLKELRSKKLSNGEELPTLENYLLQGSKDKKVKLIVEIKPAKNEALENEIVAKTLKIIQGLKLENQCEFISFSLNICKEIKKFQPQLMVQYLNGDLTPKQIKDLHIDGLDYHYTLFQKNATWIAEAKDLGLVTNSWTVNDEVVYQELKTMGINFITTNIPETLKNK